MAGAHLRMDVAIDDEAIQDGLKRLATQGGSLRRVGADIGEELLNSTRERFRQQQDPSGHAWAELSRRYRRRKNRNQDKTLLYRGHLFNTLNYQVTDDEVRVGSPLIYAATHQFGDEERSIPARPFLGLSDADRTAVLGIIQDHLRRALGSGK